MVANEALNGLKLNRYGYPIPISPTVLSVASEDPAAGFRLGTLEEMTDVYDMLHSRVRQVQGAKRFGMRSI